MPPTLLGLGGEVTDTKISEAVGKSLSTILGNCHIGDIGYYTTQLWYLSGNLGDLLVDGFKYFLFSSLFGEDSHFDDHIFQMG